MIETTIEEDGDGCFVTIPADAMERHGLQVGDTISFTPIHRRRSSSLSDTMQQALDDVIRKHQDALKHLAGEEQGTSR